MKNTNMINVLNMIKALWLICGEDPGDTAALGTSSCCAQNQECLVLGTTIPYSQSPALQVFPSREVFQGFGVILFIQAGHWIPSIGKVIKISSSPWDFCLGNDSLCLLQLASFVSCLISQL